MIKLGDKVRDTISGFTGVATSRHEYLFGCIRIGVSSDKLHEGKVVDQQVFDEQQLELALEPEKTPAPVSPRGGPGMVPSARVAPR